MGAAKLRALVCIWLALSTSGATNDGDNDDAPLDAADLADLGGGDDGDEDDGLTDEVVEAFTINSPKDVSDQWHKAIMDQRKRGGDLNMQPGGALYDRARKGAKERGAVRSFAQTAAMAQNMLAAPARAAAAIGPPGGGATPVDAKAAATAAREAASASAVAPAASDSGGGGGTALVLTEHYNRSLALYANITAGAVAGTGAMRYNDSVRDPQKKPDFNPLDTVWSMAQEMKELALNASEASADVDGKGEAAADAQGGTGRHAARFPTATDLAMQAWFEEGGGLLPRLEYSRVGKDARTFNQRGLAVVAAEGGSEGDGALEEGEVLLTVPLRLLMSAQSAMRTKIPNQPDTTATYGDRRHLKDAFAHNQRWALATFLLTQMYADGVGEGAGSKWAPYLATLRLHQLTTSVVRELEGTYAAELRRTWDDETRACESWINENVCQKHGMSECHRDPKRLGSRTFSFEDYAWALGIVRSYSFNITKTTTGNSFMALVPFADLLQHKQGAGGSAVLGLDNVVTLRAGDTFGAGEAVAFDRAPFTDAETLLLFRDVAEGHKGTDVLRDWRRAVSLPPRASDLWRNANDLHLYGEDEDKEENEAMAQVNEQLASLGTDDMNAEEKLMMLGMAENAEAAALMVRGEGAGRGGPAAHTQLYAAPDPEDQEDEKAQQSANRLAEMAQQMQGAAAVGHVDRSVAKVLAANEDFFLRGTKPLAGLDAVDEMLLRKMKLLEKCGAPDEYKLVGAPHRHAVTPQLACAVRINVMNESDLDLFCNTTQGGWHDITCHEDTIDGGLNWTRPISPNNERATLSALAGSVRLLLAGYSTADEEDESLLMLRETLPPITRSAVVLRLREKRLLRRALHQVEQGLARLGGDGGSAGEGGFQGTELAGQAGARRAKVLAARKQEAERKARHARAVAEYGRPRPVVVLRLDLLKLKMGDVDSVGLEGEDGSAAAEGGQGARANATEAAEAARLAAWRDPFADEGGGGARSPRRVAALRALLPSGRRDAEGCFEYCARIAPAAALEASVAAGAAVRAACDAKWRNTEKKPVDMRAKGQGGGLDPENPSLRQCEAGFTAGYGVGCSWVCVGGAGEAATATPASNRTGGGEDDEKELKQEEGGAADVLSLPVSFLEDAFFTSSVETACALEGAAAAHAGAYLHRKACAYGLEAGAGAFLGHLRAARTLERAEDANTAVLSVREGEHLRRAVKAFVKRHALPKPKVLAKKVEARARAQIKAGGAAAAHVLRLAMPVVVNGTMDILAVKGQQNVSDAVETFVLFHRLPANVHEDLLRVAKYRTDARASKKPLLSVPISAPDGRPLVLSLVDGEQHDISMAVQRFAQAQRLDVAKTLKGLLPVVNKRLHPAIGVVPVAMGDAKDDIALRVSQGDDLLKVVTAFCEQYGLDDTAGNQVLNVARARFQAQ